jgi:cytochrome c oxidase assembly protein subunit 15
MQGSSKKIINKKFKSITLITIILLIVQVALGTAVREQIDVISRQLNYDAREYWIAKLDYVFYIHRSFSLVVAAFCLYIFWQVKKSGVVLLSNNLIIICVAAVIVLGIAMAYFNIPAIAQPLHLLFSSLLFISLSNNWLKTA